jgi:hypothetical protein
VDDGVVEEVVMRYPATGFTVEVAVNEEMETVNKVEVAGSVKAVTLGGVAETGTYSAAPMSQAPLAGLVYPSISQVKG